MQMNAHSTCKASKRTTELYRPPSDSGTGENATSDYTNHCNLGSTLASRNGVTVT